MLHVSRRDGAAAARDGLDFAEPRRPARPAEGAAPDETPRDEERPRPALQELPLTPGGDPGRGRAPSRGIRYLRRCFSFGVTQVPVARQTTTGGSRISAAESFTSGAERITLRASKAIFRLVFPTAEIVPSASM